MAPYNSIFMLWSLAEFSPKKHSSNLVVDTGCYGTALLENQVFELNVFGEHRATSGVHLPGLAPQRPFTAKVPADGQRSTGVIVIYTQGFVEVDFLFRGRSVHSNFEILLAGKCPDAS
jgi:hypothetical protein